MAIIRDKQLMTLTSSKYEASKNDGVISTSSLDRDERELKIINASLLSALKYLDEDQICQLIAENMTIITAIVNPSAKMQYIALQQRPYLISEIDNITEYNTIFSIDKSGYYAFSSMYMQCQTVKVVKYVWLKHRSEISIDHICPSLYDEPELKDIIDELRLEKLGKMQCQTI